MPKNHHLPAMNTATVYCLMLQNAVTKPSSFRIADLAIATADRK